MQTSLSLPSCISAARAGQESFEPEEPEPMTRTWASRAEAAGKGPVCVDMSQHLKCVVMVAVVVRAAVVVTDAA